jgi:coenzyme F420-dependent glucose-6-phosphate dehydrogenase
MAARKSVIKKKSIGYMVVPDLRDTHTLLNHAELAAKAGFSVIWVPDHFHPWFHTGAFEANSWIFLSAAMERIKTVPFASGVTVPILRYHPGIVAQAFATLEVMHGPRIILGVGSGEALNEIPLGFEYPPLPERIDRMVEAITVMRKLGTEEFVDFKGKYYTLKKANLYMKSTVPIYISALGPKTAKIAGKIGDGFITFPTPMDRLKNVIFPKIREGAQSVGRSFDDITKVLELDVSLDQDYKKALDALRPQKPTLVPGIFNTNEYDPRKLEARGNTEVSDEDLAKAFIVGTSVDDHIARIEEAFDAGFDHVFVSSNSPDEERFIDEYRKKVIPYFENRSGE